MPDEFEKAMDIEEHNLALRLAEAARAARERLTPSEPPDEDEDGNRACLDCGEWIPRARVESVNAVRCVACTARREDTRRLQARLKGGNF